MTKFKIDFLKSYDNDAILAELKRIASQTGKQTVTKADLDKYGRISYPLVWKRFGCLRKALELAGLVPNRYTNASDDELFQIIIKLWELTLEKEGRTPLRKDLKRYGFPVSGDVYIRRFGTWKKALMRAYNSIETVASLPEKDNTEPVEQRHVEKRDKRHGISIRKRFFVMKRDSFACTLCGASGHGVRLEVDHKVPVAQGGTDALDNLQTLCFECNRGKRDSLK